MTLRKSFEDVKSKKEWLIVLIAAYRPSRVKTETLPLSGADNISVVTLMRVVLVL